MDNQPSRTFKVSLLAVYQGFAFVLVVVLVALLFTRVIKDLAIYQTPDFDVAMLLLRLVAGVALGLALLVPIAYLVVGRCRVTVSPTGLLVCSALGRERTVAWADLREVTVAGNIGLRTLKMRPATGKPLALPLALSDPAGFRQAVLEWAPADNPLRGYLEGASH